MGAELAGKILNRLRYDKKTISRVTLLVRNHTRQLQPEEINLRQAVADLGAETVQQLLEVKRADIKAHNNCDMTEVLQLFDTMEVMLKQILQRGDCCTLKQLAVSGRDLTALGISGQQVGQILNQLLQIVIQQPEKNDKMVLLELVKEELA